MHTYRNVLAVPPDTAGCQCPLAHSPVHSDCETNSSQPPALLPKPTSLYPFAFSLTIHSQVHGPCSNCSPLWADWGLPTQVWSIPSENTVSSTNSEVGQKTIFASLHYPKYWTKLRFLSNQTLLVFSAKTLLLEFHFTLFQLLRYLH